VTETLTQPLPLLGVAGAWGDRETALARRLDDLHQLIYMRGGVRPTNAALEELAKVLLLRLWADRAPATLLSDGTTLAQLVNEPEHVGSLVATTKEAFTRALRCPDFRTSLPHGGEQGLWPDDEPFRLTSADVLIAAIDLAGHVTGGGHLEVSDPLGAAFDALLSGRYDHSGGLGTFLTPSAVARAMADISLSFVDTSLLTDGRPFLSADPFCGTGRFLVAAAEALHNKIGGRPHDYADRVVGADQAPSSVAKARINLLMYGAPAAQVWTVEDSVTSEAVMGLAGQVPLVLTNPPFGAGKYDSGPGIAFAAGSIPSLRGRSRVDPAIACMVRAASLLSPGGVLGIVMPDGLVHSPAFAEFLAHSGMTANGALSVVANISLPTATFALSGTVAKTSAVFLKRDDPPNRVWLARCSHVGFVKAAGRAIPDPHGSDLPTIVKTLQSPDRVTPSKRERTVVHSHEPFIASVRTVDLQSLDPAVIDSQASLSRDASEVTGEQVRLGEFLAAIKSRRVAASKDRPFLSVLHIDELGAPAWEEAEAHLPTTPGGLAPSGSVLVSLLNPSKLRATVVPDCYSEVACSAEFGVFKTNVDPYAIIGLLYLESSRAQLRPLGRGTSSSRRRITAREVEDLVVPSLTGVELDALGSQVRAALEGIRISRRILFDLFNA